MVLLLAGGQQGTGNGQKTDAVRPTQSEHPEPAVIAPIGMVKNPGEQFDVFAPIAAVKGVIGNQHLHVIDSSQGIKFLADHPRTQQKQESAPIGMNRVEKPIHGVLGHVARPIRDFQSAKEVSPGKNQSKQQTEHTDR